MDELGFMVHPEKQSLGPSHILVYLGFILNSLNMTLTLTQENIEKIIPMCKALPQQPSCTIRHLTKVIESFVATQPGIMMATLHYKKLEH